MGRKRFGLRRRRRMQAGKRRMLLFCVPALALIAVLLLDAAIRPSLYALAAVEAHNTAVRVIHTAAESVIEARAQALSSAVRVVYDENDRVTGITTDIVQLNLLKSQVASAIEDAFAAAPTAKMQVPLGAATHVALLAGRGPMVPVRIAYAATAQPDFESRFSAAGVNQTLHSVLLHVRATVTVFLPRGQTTEEIATDFCAAQTVIVGGVPDVSINR